MELSEIVSLICNHPKKSFLIYDIVRDWQQRYYAAFKKIKDAEKYLVYTEEDHKIPFRPEESSNYVKLFPNILNFAKGTIGKCSLETIADISACCKYANQISEEIYLKYPTVMPRLKKHLHSTMKMVQYFDDPFNCCPSLHIAHSVLMYNISDNFADRELFKPIEKISKSMINAVLYTKQHSLLDVAMGILCAKFAYEKYFKTPFQDLTDSFENLKKDNPTINYDQIKQIYQHGVELQRKGKSLLEITRQFLEEYNLPKVKPKEKIDHSYYHSKNKRIIIAY